MKVITIFLCFILFSFNLQLVKSQKGAWRARAAYAGTNATGSFIIGTKGYVIDNFNLREYDPSLNSWSNKTAVPNATYELGFFSIGTKGYACGGFYQSIPLELDRSTNDVYEYNAGLNNWIKKADMPTIVYPGRINGVGFTIGSTGYILGGNYHEYDATIVTDDYFKDLLAYNQTLNSWSSKQSFPGKYRQNPFVFVIGTKAYVGCGDSLGLTYYKDVYEYDQTSNVWTKLTDFPIVGTQQIAFSYNGKGYVGIGRNGGTYSKEMYEYDPVSMGWTKINDFIGIAKIYKPMQIGTSMFIAGGNLAGNTTWEFNPSINLSISKTNVKCKGDNNGVISLNVTGGTTPYTYSWSNAATTSSITNLTVGVYSVTVTDANTYQIQSTITLTEPSLLLAITGSITHVDCNGAATGVINSSITGGNTPYVYSWSNSLTTASISTITANTYTLSVTDANSCIKTSSFSVTQPAALVINPTVNSVICYGGSNGSVTTSVTGGFTPYSYSWSNGAVTSNITGLSSSAYSITLTDNRSCKMYGNYNVSQPGNLSISNSITHVSCKSSNNGTINITVTGGTTPYSYSWSNGILLEDLSALTAGNYNITVTDSKSCSTNGMMSVTEPALALQLSAANITHVSCSGYNNGSINLTTNGGTTPYNYSWSNASTNSVLSTLIAGSYTVTITDSKLCTITSNYSITQPTGVSVTPTITNASCNGANDGAINLSVSGGSSPFNYSWNSGESSQNISNKTSNNYTLTITDTKGCTFTATYFVDQTVAMSLNATITHPICNSLNTGIIGITHSGGTTPYSYMWSNSASSKNLIGVSAGNYTVTIYDNNLCSKTGSFTITQPAIIGANLSIGNVTCGRTNGAVNAIISGGVTPYSLSWSTGATISGLNNLNAGTYSITITDANSCTKSSSIQVTNLTTVTQNICMVGVDLETGKYMVTWERTKNKGIKAYIIFKESTVANVYNAIDTVPFNLLSVWVDTASKPETKSEKYKIAVLDSCGNTSTLSPYHKPLTISSSLGTNSINLSLEEYTIEGGSMGFVTYRILRGIKADSLIKIDSMATGKTIYNDINPPAGRHYYRVSGVIAGICSPLNLLTKASSGPFSQSVSNLEDNRLKENSLDEIQKANINLTLSPNPCNEHCKLEFTISESGRVQISVIDILGNTIMNNNKANLQIGNYTEIMNVKELSSGIYYIRFELNNKVIIKRLIKEKD